MRLLKRDNNGVLSLTNDLADKDVPQYVILSHTWGPAEQEVTIQDFQTRASRSRSRKAGFKKIQFCSDQAALDGYQYIWIDTCCIDKTNSVELTEAINSMFRWYREAARCYVYLSDMHVVEPEHTAWLDDLARSRWFTRGWTLQELLAPRSVEFFSSEGTRLGSKASLAEAIGGITGISVDALHGRPLAGFSVAQRMAWAARRNTTRKEDEAYSLLGIFDIYMPLIYGERERALVRLRDEIDKSLQGSSTSDSAVDTIDPTSPEFHPVKRNYRKVHVTILYWETDEIHDVVNKISQVFRSLYRYEVREIALPHRQKVDLMWPWIDESVVDERDLQIMYYLGSTTKYLENQQSDTFPQITAVPARQTPIQHCYPEDPQPSQNHSEHYPHRTWLSSMINFPSLGSDSFLILDCFVEDLTGSDTHDNIRFLFDNDNSWARYLVLFTGYPYPNPYTRPGILSEKLMTVLEDLAASRRFYAREGMITSRVMLDKLMAAIPSDTGRFHVFGNEGKDSIHLVPLEPSAAQ